MAQSRIFIQGVNQSDDAAMAAFYETNLKYAINGYTFCNNAPTMRMNKVGQTDRY